MKATSDAGSAKKLNGNYNANYNTAKAPNFRTPQLPLLQQHHSGAPDSEEGTEEDAFRMFREWTPSSAFNELLDRAKMPRRVLTAAVLAEFVAYWLMRDERRTERHWQLALFKQLQWRQQVRQQKKQKPVKQGDFIARHTDRRWSEGV